MSGAGIVAGARIVGVGVDAVDVARFRRVLDRRPRVAARCFTESEQSDATHSADVAQSLAARFAAKEAVMKALGTGIGSFALTDVEVRRTPGAAPPATPPISCCTAARPSWRAPRVPPASISR